MSRHEYDRMLETLREVNDLCARAQMHYHNAVGLEAGADRADNRAKFGAVWDGNGFFEKHDQHKRAKKMNHARDESNRGTQELRRAFSMIPRDRPCLLRERYPREMAPIGTVPIPELEGGHFGGALMMDVAGGRGGFGSEMNDMHAQREIQRNIEVLRQCEEICHHQQELLMRMTERVRADRDGRRYDSGPPPPAMRDYGMAGMGCGEGYGGGDMGYGGGMGMGAGEVYVDGGGMGGMGMGGGMRGGGGMGMVEGMMMGEMMVDDRRRREREEFNRDVNRDIRRDEFRRDEFGPRW